ncbi:helix-turn-helix domain-containing protein [Streptomyces sp. NPDC012510]|uniref:helix-turn-helix domain-containing protein n=1 Tax=Streptomyces sp. NPDC012510 TaxID=3364838 RepID=UPI0036ECBF6B
MSLEATVWALKYAPPMPPQLLGTLFGLADHADKHGRGAYPSVRTLAAYACKSERSVQRDLKELLKLGLIRDGNQSEADHIPQERRPHVYDLAMESTVPGGRAGDDAVTQASRVTLASSRARGKRKPAGQHEVGVTSTSGVTPTSPPDAHVTSGVTPTSEWGDVHVATGVTSTSPKPSFEPPTNRPMNQRGVRAVSNTPARDSDGRPPLTELPDDFALTDTMRSWVRNTYPRVDVDSETAKFRLHHQGESTRRRNWYAAWQKWIAGANDHLNRYGGNVVPFGQPQPRLSTTDARVQAALDLGRQMQAEYDAAQKEAQ